MICLVRFFPDSVSASKLVFYAGSKCCITVLSECSLFLLEAVGWYKFTNFTQNQNQVDFGLV